jgi:hypothetical protein
MIFANRAFDTFMFAMKTKDVGRIKTRVIWEKIVFLEKIILKASL